MGGVGGGDGQLSAAHMMVILTLERYKREASIILIEGGFAILISPEKSLWIFSRDKVQCLHFYIKFCL